LNEDEATKTKRRALPATPETNDAFDLKGPLESVKRVQIALPCSGNDDLFHTKVKTRNTRKRKKEAPFFAGSGALSRQRERENNESETLTSRATVMRFTIVFKRALLSLVILSSCRSIIGFAKRSTAHDHDRLPGWHGEIHSVEDTIARRKQELEENQVLRTSE